MLVIYREHIFLLVGIVLSVLFSVILIATAYGVALILPDGTVGLGTLFTFLAFLFELFVAMKFSIFLFVRVDGAIGKWQGGNDILKGGEANG